MQPHQMLYEQELMLARMDELEREILDLDAARQVYSARTLEDMRGKKKNLDVPIEIPIAQGTVTTVDTGRYTHSESGMFVCTKICAFWKEDVEQRWRPISSVADAEQAPAVVNSIDFLWTIQEGNNGYSWQPDPMPSPLLQGTWERPFILPIAAQITGSMTVKVGITPTRGPAEDGMLSFVLRGYLTLDPPPPPEQ